MTPSQRARILGRDRGRRRAGQLTGWTAAAGALAAAVIGVVPAQGPVDASAAAPAPADPQMARRDGIGGAQLRVGPVACTAHGLCAELLPELIALDEWGYPLLDREPVPAGLAGAARRAVAACPRSPCGSRRPADPRSRPPAARPR